MAKVGQNAVNFAITEMISQHLTLTTHPTDQLTGKETVDWEEPVDWEGITHSLTDSVTHRGNN